MKNNTIYFVFLSLFLLISCDNDDEPIVVDDGTVGVERFLITTALEVRSAVLEEQPDLDYPEPLAVLGKENFATWIDYVSPEYTDTRAFLTIQNPSSSDIIFTYDNEVLNVNQEFELKTPFTNIDIPLKYLPSSGSKVEFDLVFRNSRGSVINKTWSVKVKE